MTPLAAYLVLFLAIGVGFIFIHLLAGMLIRPRKQNPEKETIYECGEPTIGSAWIQFDLRFYVVALLFVIFDVEVAFFFPWAEIFGKSNAIRATSKLETFEEKREFAAKVTDLASPRGNLSAGVASNMDVRRERALWTKLAALTPEDMEQVDRLDKDLVDLLDRFGPATHETLRGLSEKQFEAFQDQAKRLDALLKKVRAELAEETKQTRAAIDALSPDDRKSLEELLGPDNPIAPANLGKIAAAKLQGAAAPEIPFDIGGLKGLLDKKLPGRTDEVIDFLRNRLLSEMDRLNKDDVDLVPLPANRRGGWARLLPEAAKISNQQAERRLGEIKKTAAAVLAGLNGIEPRSPEIWDRMTPKLMTRLGNLTKEQQVAFEKLSPETVSALSQLPSMAKGVKNRADTLAWSAMIEILVFFGVLLVGFAYLWKRGDLAWVRSTATESTHRQPLPLAQELQATAKSS